MAAGSRRGNEAVQSAFLRGDEGVVAEADEKEAERGIGYRDGWERRSGVGEQKRWLSVTHELYLRINKQACNKLLAHRNRQ